MFSNPLQNVSEFGFMPGSKVCDLGSGKGHYALALSDQVGQSGSVYCVDIKKDVLVALKNQALEEERQNLEVIWGDIEKENGTHLKDECCDGAVFSNVLFQLKDKSAAIKEAKRIVKPGGKICIVEWSDLSFMSGIKRDDGNTLLSKDEMTEFLVANGLKLQRSFEAGDHHYGLILGK